VSLHPRAAELIEQLELEPHPEGGFYREIFRSTSLVTPADGRGARAALTTIYYLLPAGACSRWHRVASDEVWHLYEGGPLEVLELDAACGELSRHRLGFAGNVPVCTIAADHWQAAQTLGDFALVGCTVGPGFDFEDFTLLAHDAERSTRVRSTWPDLASLI
jgi:uncharacterized protein